VILSTKGLLVKGSSIRLIRGKDMILFLQKTDESNEDTFTFDRFI
jgi:hypothetical protein